MPWFLCFEPAQAGGCPVLSFIVPLLENKEWHHIHLRTRIP